MTKHQVGGMSLDPILTPTKFPLVNEQSVGVILIMM
jgi:hypothetical protein